MEVKKIKEDLVSFNRWEIAQKSEREFWDGYTSESLSKELEKMYLKKVEFLVNQISKYKKLDKNSKILQVGSGPMGIIYYFPTEKKYAIDPLADFYKEKFKFNYGKVNFKKGVGEEIPSLGKSFDVVILTNVLDHVHLPEKVLSEIRRVLKDDGIFHFENYVYQKKFIFLAKIWGKLKEIFSGEMFNIHHPYMFTKKRVRILLQKNFSILYEELGKDVGDYENFEELKEFKRNSERLSTKIPALFGIYGTINYVAVCKKN